MLTIQRKNIWHFCSLWHLPDIFCPAACAAGLWWYNKCGIYRRRAILTRVTATCRYTVHIQRFVSVCCHSYKTYVYISNDLLFYFDTSHVSSIRMDSITSCFTSAHKCFFAAQVSAFMTLSEVTFVPLFFWKAVALCNVLPMPFSLCLFCPTLNSTGFHSPSYAPFTDMHG